MFTLNAKEVRGGLRIEKKTMDISEAVLTAKKCIQTMFADEGITNLGLEEAYFDESEEVSHITLGLGIIPLTQVRSESAKCPDIAVTSSVNE